MLDREHEVERKYNSVTVYISVELSFGSAIGTIHVISEQDSGTWIARDIASPRIGLDGRPAQIAITRLLLISVTADGLQACRSTGLPPSSNNLTPVCPGPLAPTASPGSRKYL